MRKIVPGEFVWLDGVIEAPEELTLKYGGPAFMEYIGAGMPESDALLPPSREGRSARPRRRRLCSDELLDAAGSSPVGARLLRASQQDDTGGTL